jgi:hypothetical protein
MHPSIWNQITPLSDGFWHAENLLVTRAFRPIGSTSAIGVRGVVNEAAFRAFYSFSIAGGGFDRSLLLAAVDAVSRESIAYVNRLAPTANVARQSFDEDARSEATILAERLLLFFPRLRSTDLRPAFPGCGLISSCEGDIIEDGCLYEVKAGERGFRISDLRQLLVYSALAYSAGTMSFTSIGLFNPRTGAAWMKTLDEVCESIAGTRAVDTLSRLVDTFSGISVSR